MLKMKDKRDAGAILERGGISQRIISIAQEIAEGSYKDAIKNAGRIAALVDAATYDGYWDAKAKEGKLQEEFILEDLNKGVVTRERMIAQVDPYA